MAFNERSLDGIGVFIAVVDSGSFAAAAIAVGMSPPGVSRAIARLEKRLGIRLFDRTTRSVHLTDEGRRFHEQLLPVLADLDEVTSAATAAARQVKGRLRVNVDPLFSSLLLGPRLDAFLSRYPDLELELVTTHRLGDMIADGFDLAVRFGEPVAGSLVARRLLETRILTVASPAYLARHGRPREPADLVDHTCIHFREAETGKPFDWEFHRGNEIVPVAVKGRLTVNDVRTLHEACLSGHGIAQVMQFGAAPLLATGQLVELFSEWPDERFPLYALHPSRVRMSARTRSFLDFIQTLARG